MKKKKQMTGGPVVFWHSDPVMPDETIVLSGADFSARSMVELALLGNESEEKWTAVAPAQWSEVSLKAIVPAAWPKGVYACRVRDGKAVSKTVFLNAPDVWWMQGDSGLNAATAGGWLRLLGKCLDFAGGAKVRLIGASGAASEPELLERSDFSLKVVIPADLAPGSYHVEVSNGCGGAAGMRQAGTVAINAAVPESPLVFNVQDYGADPTGMKDSTLAIVQAIERAQGSGGGVIFLPRGRYRVDGGLRSGVYVEAPLLIPPKITLRGAGPDQTMLWWPTREKPLMSLVELRPGSALEDLAIYTQGPHQTGVTADSGEVRIKNILIRMVAYYLDAQLGRSIGSLHQKVYKDSPRVMGFGISLWGQNNQVVDCDVLATFGAIDIRDGRGSRVAGNRFRSYCAFSYGSEMIFENNTVLCTCSLSLHMGGSCSRHIFFANNRISDRYYEDREGFTLDGHGGAYCGRVKNVAGNTFELVGRTFTGDGGGMLGTTAYIVDGRGVGQYRSLTHYDHGIGKVTLDRPWDVEPDAESIVSIAGFNGRHLIVGNTMTDIGAAVQLYPANGECIVAGNRSVRAGNFNSLGASGTYRIYNDPKRMTRMEVSWYNQFLGNEVVAGNVWGGADSEADRWIGGDNCMLVHGCARHYTFEANGERKARYQTPEWLAAALGEPKPRDRSISMSRWQVVRRHHICNNGFIRVRGVVTDAVVEHCHIAHSQRGIRIDMEVDVDMPYHRSLPQANGQLDPGFGQLFVFAPEPDAKHPALPFLRPEGVLVRGNRFEDVNIPYSGTAMDGAQIEA